MHIPSFAVTEDSYALLTRHQSEAADVIITDPPYDAHVQDKMLAGGNAGTLLSYAHEVKAGFNPLTSYAWVQGAVAKAKRWSLFFCGIEQLGYYRDAAPDRWVRSGIYVKVRAMPQMTGDRPGNRCEGIAIMHGAHTKKRWGGKGTHAFWETLEDSPRFVAMPENRKATQHPTAKPLLLCMQLVELFSEPDELIFDPFCGTGNVGIACMLLGRRFIGLDNDATHVRNAVMRAALTLPNAGVLIDKFAAWKNKRHADDVKLSNVLEAIGEQ